MQTITLYNCDVLAGLAKLSNESIDCIVTSPPYWGLRDYGIKGQLGLEPNHQDYLKHMLQITAELKRVLKPSGTMWWNHGDTYSGSCSGNGDTGLFQNYRKRRTAEMMYSTPKPQRNSIIPAKSKMQIPERLSIRMVDEQGWVLRSDIIWHKPNHMPSSVKDRLSNSYEHIYLFAKAKKYYFNLNEIRVPVQYPADDIRRMQQDKLAGVKPFAKGTDIARHNSFNQRIRDAQKGRLEAKYGSMYKATAEEIANYDEKHYKGKLAGTDFEASGSRRARELRIGYASRQATQMAEREEAKRLGDKELIRWVHEHGGNPNGKNPGDVWKITTKPYKEAHFAVFPPDLPERCIKAGSPPDGIVLDPFAGSGTTLQVARQLGRSAVGIEIKPDYCNLIKKRLTWGFDQNIEWRSES